MTFGTIRKCDSRKAIHYDYKIKLMNFENEKWKVALELFKKKVDEQKWKDSRCCLYGNYKTGYFIEYRVVYQDEESWEQFCGFDRTWTRVLKDKGQLLLEFLEYLPYFKKES